MNNYRYRPEAFKEWAELEAESKPFVPSVPIVPGVEKIINACEFLKHWRDNAKDLTEPLWWCGICAIHTEPGAEKTIHEISKDYPGYTPQETDRKIKDAGKLSGPMTCKGIREKTGFEGCPSAGCCLPFPSWRGSD